MKQNILADHDTVVLTGPSEGSLAAEAAYNFAAAPQPPAQIILLGRTRSKIQPVLDRIAHINPSIDAAFVPLDLTDNSAVRAAARDVRALAPRIDVLINSAGVMALADYALSVDGVERQLAACHVGHFLLTALLFPQLAAAAPDADADRDDDARVVTLSSMGYETSAFRLDDWNFSEGRAYDRWLAYGQAKSANIMFTRELARRSPSAAAKGGRAVTALVVHPGMVLESGILQNASMEALGAAFEAMKKQMAEAGEGEVQTEAPKSLAQGCATMVLASVRPDLRAHSGVFLRDCDVFPESQLKPWVKVPADDEKLWELTEGLVGEKFL